MSKNPNIPINQYNTSISKIRNLELAYKFLINFRGHWQMHRSFTVNVRFNNLSIFFFMSQTNIIHANRQNDDFVKRYAFDFHPKCALTNGYKKYIYTSFFFLVEPRVRFLRVFFLKKFCNLESSRRPETCSAYESDVRPKYFLSESESHHILFYKPIWNLKRTRIRVYNNEIKRRT